MRQVILLGLISAYVIAADPRPSHDMPQNLSPELFDQMRENSDPKAGPLDPALVSKARELWASKVPSEFPCNKKLASTFPRSNLILSGERHGDPISVEDGARLLEKASLGKCVVGMEGTHCAKPVEPLDTLADYGVMMAENEDTVGVDDEFTHGLGMIHLARRAFKDKAKDIAGAKSGLVDEIRDNQYLQNAWEKLKSKPNAFKDADERAIASTIDRLLTAKSRTDFLDQAAALKPDSVWHTRDKAFLGLLDSFQTAFGEMAEEKFKEEKMVPDGLGTLLEDLKVWKNVDPIEDFLFVEWRNQFMARRIAELFCKHMPSGKDIFVIVGSLHLGGLKELLLKMSKGQTNPYVRDFREEYLRVQRATQPPKVPAAGIPSKKKTTP